MLTKLSKSTGAESRTEKLIKVIEDGFVILIIGEDRILIKITHVSKIIKGFYVNNGISDSSKGERQLNENNLQDQSEEITPLYDEKTMEDSDQPSLIQSEEITAFNDEKIEEISDQFSTIPSENALGGKINDSNGSSGSCGCSRSEYYGYKANNDSSGSFRYQSFNPRYQGSYSENSKNRSKRRDRNR